jgi:hypothetical protein
MKRLLKYFQVVEALLTESEGSNLFLFPVIFLLY